MSEPKELNFFLADRGWKNGLDWYRNHFDANAKVRGESSPNYTAAPVLPGAPERMASAIPDAKLIFMVRDPIDRMRSQWIHNYSRHQTNNGLRDALLGEEIYVARSRYFFQIQQFLVHYPLERIMVIDQGELLKDRAATIRRVFEFVGIDPDFTHPKFARERLRSGARLRRSWLEHKMGPRFKSLPEGLRESRWLRRKDFEKTVVDPDLHRELVALIADDISAFRQLTGRKFDNWSL